MDLIDICDVNLSISKPFSIKVRVENKSDVRSFGDDGKVISIDVLDTTDKIRCIAFGLDAERLSNYVKEDRVYVFKNVFVNSAKKKFNVLSHDCEILFNSQTTIELEINDLMIPLHGKFIPLADLFGLSNDSLIDIMGIIIKVQDEQFVKKKDTGENLILQHIVIADNSNAEITAVLWNQHVTSFKGKISDVIVITNARKSTYKSRPQLSLSTLSRFKINPEWEETRILKDWYLSEGQFETRVNLSQIWISSEFSNEDENQNFFEIKKKILEQITVDKEQIEKRLYELDENEKKIKLERANLNFKKQRLHLEETNFSYVFNN